MFKKLIRSRMVGALLMTACAGGCAGGSGQAENDGDGDADDGGSGGGAEVPLPKDVPSPATPALWRLTERQYRNALRDLLGAGVSVPEVAAEQSAGGLAAIAAGTTTASEQEVERYELLATKLVTEVFTDTSARGAVVKCAAKDAVSDGCAAEFLSDFGHRAFRRPLTKREQERFNTVASSSKQVSGDAWVGLQTAVTAMLQSPKFLYRMEIGSEDSKRGGRKVLNGQERASRLAFLLWDSLPDQALLDAAEDGSLMTAAGMRAQAQRLWDDPRARVTWRAFIDENYRLNDLGRSSAQVSPALLASMKEEVLRAAESAAFDENGSFLTFFTRRDAFLDPALRSHYGLPEGQAGFARTTLPEEQERMGFFGSAAFATLTSTALHTSPTSRGKFIRERILCQEVPAPAADVNTALPPASATARTTRERLDAHRKDPACSSCHNFMDPPGYAFERLDQVGKYRTQENGTDLRTDGEMESDGEKVAFSGPRELVDVLMAQPETGACLARSVLRQATGYLETRLDTESDERLVTALAEVLKRGDYAISDFIMNLVASDAFLTRQDGSSQDESSSDGESQ